MIIRNQVVLQQPFHPRLGWGPAPLAYVEGEFLYIHPLVPQCEHAHVEVLDIEFPGHLDGFRLDCTKGDLINLGYHEPGGHMYSDTDIQLLHKGYYYAKGPIAPVMTFHHSPEWSLFWEEQER